MTETVLTFGPDGTAVGLYTEAIPLQELGRLSIRRASTIEYDDARQCWVVGDPAGTELFRAPGRQQCLDWEREYFNNRKEANGIHSDDPDHQPPRPAHPGVSGAA